MKISALSFTNNRISMQYKKPLPSEENSGKQPSYLTYTRPAGYSLATLAAGFGFYNLFKGKPSEFTKTLAAAMNQTAGRHVSPHSLSSVIDGKQLLEIIPKLEKKNYIFNAENAQNGIFRADLHSHSKHSDGNGLVKNILEEAADYADELYKKTKQKFIFALTDHDTTEGLKEALEIISSNPKRYKNLQFVPGIEVSFAHSSPKSSNPCEMSEVLVYGVNPYSEKVSKFVENIRQKRTNMVNNYFTEVGNKFPLTKFSFDEFSKYYEFEKYGNLMNVHWRAYHYAQTKNAVTAYANKTGKNPEELYSQIMNDFKGASIETLVRNDKLPAEYREQGEMTNILKKFAPHFENDKLIASSENTFEEVIEAFKDEPNIFMAYAHPCFYAQHVNDPVQGLRYFTEHSNGLIKASETFHQAYKPSITEQNISEIQKATENLQLLNLGGRDNHNSKLF